MFLFQFPGKNKFSNDLQKTSLSGKSNNNWNVSLTLISIDRRRLLDQGCHLAVLKLLARSEKVFICLNLASLQTTDGTIWHLIFIRPGNLVLALHVYPLSLLSLSFLNLFVSKICSTWVQFNTQTFTKVDIIIVSDFILFSSTKIYNMVGIKNGLANIMHRSTHY